MDAEVGGRQHKYPENGLADSHDPVWHLSIS